MKIFCFLSNILFFFIYILYYFNYLVVVIFQYSKQNTFKTLLKNIFKIIKEFTKIYLSGFPKLLRNSYQECINGKEYSKEYIRRKNLKNYGINKLFLFFELISFILIYCFFSLILQSNTAQNLSIILSNTKNYQYLNQLKPRNIIILKDNKQIYNSLEFEYQNFDEYNYNKVLIKQFYPHSINEFYIYIKNSLENFKKDFFNLKGKEFLLKYEINLIVLLLFLMYFFSYLTNLYIEKRDEKNIYNFMLNLEKETEELRKLNKKVMKDKEELEKNENFIFKELKKYQDKLTFNLNTLKYSIDNNLIDSSIITSFRTTLESLLKEKILEFPYFNNSMRLDELIALQKKNGMPDTLITYMHTIRKIGNLSTHNSNQLEIEKYEILAYLNYLLKILEYFENNKN